MNLNKKLESILIKFQLNEYKDSIDNVIKSIIKEIPSHFRVGIRGGGTEAETILPLIENDLNIVAIFDISCENIKTNESQYPVIHPTKIMDYDLDIVIITSSRHKKEMMNELDAIGYRNRTMDIYQELSNRYKASDSFTIKNIDYLDYLIINNLKYHYIEARDKIEKQYYLRRLIIKYIEIRDFVYMKKYINHYINSKYEDYRKYIDFLGEVDSFLIDIKDILNSKNTNDIVFFVIDALRAKDVLNIENKTESMPFINRILENSIVFLKAFASTTNTRGSMYSIITGKNFLEDGLYDKKPIDLFQESSWMKDLYGKEYRIISYFPKGIFSEDTKERILIKGEEGYSYKPVTRVLWEYICDLNDNKTDRILSILHFFTETRFPYLCGEHTGEAIDFLSIAQRFEQHRFEELIINQYNESLNYIDKQLEFYFDLLSEDTLKIIFGDHGKGIEHCSNKKDEIFRYIGWHDDRMHVPLVINGANIEPLEYSKLFSLKDIGKILLNILNYNDPDIEEISYVEFQRDPIYNKRVIENIILAGGEKFTNGFKVIRSESDKYILMGDGQEEYYILPNEETNLIGEEKYKSRIEDLRNCLKTRTFPQFDSEKYKHNKNA